MCGVQLSERVATRELLERYSLLDLKMVMTRRRLNWYGHVVRRSEKKRWEGQKRPGNRECKHIYEFLV